MYLGMSDAQILSVLAKRMVKCLFSLRIVILCFMSVVLFIGCKSSYDVTVSSMGRSRVFSGVTKPVYNKATGRYVFKDSLGQEFAVPKIQVKEIAPHGESSEPKFIAPAPKK